MWIFVGSLVRFHNLEVAWIADDETNEVQSENMRNRVVQDGGYRAGRVFWGPFGSALGPHASLFPTRLNFGVQVPGTGQGIPGHPVCP